MSALALVISSAIFIGLATLTASAGIVSVATLDDEVA